jgi:hypothetical protein
MEIQEIPVHMLRKVMDNVRQRAEMCVKCCPNYSFSLAGRSPTDKIFSHTIPRAIVGLSVQPISIQFIDHTCALCCEAKSIKADRASAIIRSLTLKLTSHNTIGKSILYKTTFTIHHHTHNIPTSKDGDDHTVFTPNTQNSGTYHYIKSIDHQRFKVVSSHLSDIIFKK